MGEMTLSPQKHCNMKKVKQYKRGRNIVIEIREEFMVREIVLHPKEYEALKYHFQQIFLR